MTLSATSLPLPNTPPAISEDLRTSFLGIERIELRCRTCRAIKESFKRLEESITSEIDKRAAAQVPFGVDISRTTSETAIAPQFATTVPFRARQPEDPQIRFEIRRWPTRPDANEQNARARLIERWEEDNPNREIVSFDSLYFNSFVYGDEGGLYGLILSRPF